VIGGAAPGIYGPATVPMKPILVSMVWLAALGCSSPPTPEELARGSGGTGAAGAGGTGMTPPPPPDETGPTGWASVDDLGQNGTTGGEGGEIVEVATTMELLMAIAGTTPRIVRVTGSLGDGMRIPIGSNKTVEGVGGAELHGAVRMDGSVNVILKNLKIVGNDCTDAEEFEPNGSPDCSSGADAVTIRSGAHHIWVDHCDVSDGSDGNLDVTEQSDYVTISWTKFSYSRQRDGGHHFSNLVGGGDGAMADAGKLRVTFHHCWWADRARERMPRVRYGKVHVFNSLYTASGNNYCVGVGVFANVLTENNVFIGVSDPIETLSYSNSESVAVARNNLYIDTTGATSDLGLTVFDPPYGYQLDPTATLEAVIRNGAGPR
jgi:pectate lyase